MTRARTNMSVSSIPIGPSEVRDALERMNTKGARSTQAFCEELIQELFNPEFQVKKVLLDGKPELKFRCPKCGVWGFIDDDQYQGKVSIQCECGFHETLKLHEVGVIVSSARSQA